MKAKRRGRPSKVEALTKELEAKKMVCEQLEASLQDARSDEAAAIKRISQLEAALSEASMENEFGEQNLSEKQRAFMCLAHMFFDHE